MARVPGRATAGDAFALLAASSLVKDDAARAADVVLAVRQFVSVEPSREFRCFVLDGRLVAACQRRGRVDDGLTPRRRRHGLP